MTTNERPEQRKGSAPDRPGAKPGRPRTEPAERSDWLDAATAEELLDAALDAPHDDPRVDDLARLLAEAVAAADALPGDATAEQLVLRAFRETHTVARARAGSGRRRARGRRASRTTRVLVGGIAAVSVLSGVAIAATSGALPGPFHTGGGTPAGSAAATSPSSGAPGPSGTSGSPGASGSSGRGRPALSPSATEPAPSPQASVPPAAPGGSTDARTALTGLCASYLRAAQRGEHLDSAAQRRLDDAAGGPAEVAAYCARLAGDRARGQDRAPTAPATAPSSTGATTEATTGASARATPSTAPARTPAPHVSRPATPAGTAGPTASHGHA